MKFSVALGDDLAALTQASGTDLEAALLRLSADLEFAVPSLIAMSITIVSSEQPVTFTAFCDGADSLEVRSSLQAPVDLLIGATPGSRIVLFAAAADAFRDLAAELDGLLGERQGEIVLDAHLQLPAVGRSSGLADLSKVHQAIGVMMAAGFDPVDARAELESIAARARTNLVSAARDILAALREGREGT